MSPILFNIYINKALRKSIQKTPTIIEGNDKWNIIAFADDLHVIQRGAKQMTETIKIIQKQYKKIGLNIQPKKTTIIREKYKCDREGDDILKQELGEVEITETGRYLGYNLGDTIHEAIKWKNSTNKTTIEISSDSMTAISHIATTNTKWKNNENAWYIQQIKNEIHETQNNIIIQWVKAHTIDNN